MPAKGWKKYKIPAGFEGIQVNFCKNPNCSQYGISADTPVGTGMPPIGSSLRPGYRYGTKVSIVPGVPKRTTPSIQCRLCGGGKFTNNIPLKDNRDIHAEFTRMMSVFDRKDPTRHTGTCSKKNVSVLDHPTQFHSYGKTVAGTPRFRCKECKIVFTLSLDPALRRRDLGRTAEGFRLLFETNTHLTGVRRYHHFGTGALYRRFEHFYKQCRAFAAFHERKLVDGTVKHDWLNVAVDRQVLRANYKDHTDARFVKIWTIGAADNNSGYVFAFHPQYDVSANYQEIINDIAAQKIANKGRGLFPPFRIHSRYVVSDDYDEEVERLGGNVLVDPEDEIIEDLNDAIKQTYDKAAVRPDVEQPEDLDVEARLPAKGTLVHGDYAIYAHFAYLHRLFANSVGKVYFCFEQESAMRAACLSIFQKEIATRRCDAFYIKIIKNLTKGKRMIAYNDKKKDFDLVWSALAGMTEEQVRIFMIKAQFPRIKAQGSWKDMWLNFPLPDKSESHKQICYLTDYGDYTDDDLATLYRWSRLSGVEEFFKFNRNYVRLFARPEKKWPRFGAYNPINVAMMAEISRVYYNYVTVPLSKKGLPAMALGLIDHPATPQEIIDFRPPPT